MIRARLAAAVVASLGGVAVADGGPPGATPVAPAPDQPSLDAFANDAAADRGTVVENALTVPRGQFEVDVRGTSGFGLLDLRLGVTSTTELSIETGLVTGVGAGGTTPAFAAGIKHTLVPGRRFRLAVDASVRTVYYEPFAFLPAGSTPTPPGLDLSLSNPSYQLVSLGTVATGCVDRSCVLRLTGGGQLVYDFNNGGGIAPLVWTDVELGSEHLRVVAEGVLGAVFASGGGAEGIAATIGARTSWRHVSAELGAIIVPRNTTAEVEPAPYFGIAGRL